MAAQTVSILTSTPSTPTPSLPPTHRALIFSSHTSPLTIKSVPTPLPVPGAAIIRVLSARIISYSKDILTGARPMAFPTPLVPGLFCIGRVAALPPDSTALHLNQLVLVDPTIRSRDQPSDMMLQGFYEGLTAGSKKLMAGEWRDGVFAEFVKAPLENVFGLDEGRLLGSVQEGGLGYDVDVLAGLAQFVVGYGGLTDIGLQAGDTVIVAPATGSFGGGAAKVALAMGARVLAMGRNTEVLEALAASAPPGRVIPIPLTSDPAVDKAELAKYGPADAFFDISPATAQDSHHIVTCIEALRWGGKVSLMGGLRGNFMIPGNAVRMGLTMKGTWMYTPAQIRGFIRLVERGCLGLGEDNVRVVGRYKLEDWEAALKLAKERARPGEVVVFKPWE